jgi:sugar/nucleoside kinase (ribokinase family)
VTGERPAPARIVVAGDVMTDVVATLAGPVARGSDTPARIVQRPGGAGANVAVWLARAGVPATLIAAVGDDLPGRAAAQALAAAGVDARLTIDPARPTGSCIVLVEPGGERSMLPDPGANDALAPAPLPAAAAHLHLSGYALLRPGSRAAARALLAAARAAGLGVSVDPASAAPLAAAGADAFLGWAGPVDLLVPNRDELAVLGGDPAALIGPAREVVVTLGAEGALWTDGATTVRAAAEPVTAVDATGAGDAFAAGLLAARLAGAAPAAALASGCALAAQAVVRSGAR